MGLLITNGNCTTTRDGVGTVLADVRVFVDKQSMHFTPDGPLVTSSVLFDNGIDLVAGDYITVFARDNQPLYNPTTQQVTFPDYQFDCIVVTVIGGL